MSTYWLAPSGAARHPGRLIQALDETFGRSLTAAVPKPPRWASVRLPSEGHQLLYELRHPWHRIRPDLRGRAAGQDRPRQPGARYPLPADLRVRRGGGRVRGARIARGRAPQPADPAAPSAPG